MKSYLPIFYVVAFITLLALACEAVMPSPNVSSTATAEASPTSRRVNLQIPTPQSQGAGIACLATSHAGLICLGENGWKNYTTENSSLPDNQIRALTTCPNGSLAIAHYNGISLFDGANWSHIPKPPTVGSIDQVACLEKTQIWVTQYKNISRYQLNNWTVYPTEKIAPEIESNELVYGLDADSRGNIWVAQLNSLSFASDNIWETYTTGKGWNETLFISSLYVDEQDQPWVAHNNGIMTYQENQWVSINYGSGSFSANGITLGANQSVWVSARGKGLQQLQNGLWTNYNVKSQALSSNTVTALVSDSQGRVWAGTSYGLSVYDGSTWRTYRMDNSDLADNSITGIAISKDGPALPELLDPKPLATFKGILQQPDGSPLTNKKVELCVEDFLYRITTESPCISEQAVLVTTETDAQGQFQFSEVPTGYYHLAIQTKENEWHTIRGKFKINAEWFYLPAGETTDAGTLAVE